ncbi:FUSC family protein [Phaeacidiphilus oryzae]|uniref:FUSC family protein n=1 Tax=Phaeacidiphilus oryzae TaxID=348818 RepID=UPI0007C7A41A|nr:FUSC family protein [Phaeacidiphilus oryzae]
MARTRDPARTAPAWLAHAVTWQRGPLPYRTAARAALSIGPSLAVGVLAGSPGLGVLAALGALFVVLNDRIGAHRTAPFRLGGPALGGALGILYGSALAAYGPADSPLVAVVGLALAGLAAGALGAVGPVASAAGTQLLVTAVLGAAMALPGPGWLRASSFLAGAGWGLALRLLPAVALPGRSLLGAERAAVAAAYDTVARALTAAGTDGAQAARDRMAAALNHAQESVGGPRLHLHRAAEERLRAQFRAVNSLAEAAAALLWEGNPVPDRAVLGVRRLAAAVRSGERVGPVPAPVRADAGLRALDNALLNAALSFADPGPEAGAAGGLAYRQGFRADLREGLRRALGRSGQEYGLRVALCVAASAAVATLLHPDHWYWMPVTVAFLVKPDLGPLVSRVASRAAGTIAGALAFAGVAAAAGGGTWVLLGLAAVFGTLVPLLSARHFAAQTTAVTVLVLSFVGLAGNPGPAAWTRVVDTLAACAIVLVVGHLPIHGGARPRVAVRVVVAVRAAGRYLDHVLNRPDEREQRLLLRRAAYRALAEARAAVELTAAELPTLARGVPGWAPAIGALERVVDATTACAVRLDAGAAGVPERAVREALVADFDALAESFAGGGRARLRAAPSAECATLSAVAEHLRHAARAA